MCLCFTLLKNFFPVEVLSKRSKCLFYNGNLEGGGVCGCLDGLSDWIRKPGLAQPVLRSEAGEDADADAVAGGGPAPPEFHH